MDKKVLMALKKIINLGENLHLYQRRMNDPYNIIDHEYYREEYETYNGHVSEYQCKASRFIKEHSTENIDEINFNDIHRVNSILKAIKDVPKGANELNTSSSRINNKKSNTPPINISINNNNQNNNTITISISELFNNSGLSKEQISEFDKLLETYKKEPSQENKNSVLEKVKSFGLDVLSNIISNIILG